MAHWYWTGALVLMNGLFGDFAIILGLVEFFRPDKHLARRVWARRATTQTEMNETYEMDSDLYLPFRYQLTLKVRTRFGQGQRTLFFRMISNNWLHAQGTQSPSVQPRPGRHGAWSFLGVVCCHFRGRAGHATQPRRATFLSNAICAVARPRLTYPTPPLQGGSVPP